MRGAPYQCSRCGEVFHRLSELVDESATVLCQDCEVEADERKDARREEPGDGDGKTGLGGLALAIVCMVAGMLVGTVERWGRGIKTLWGSL